MESIHISEFTPEYILSLEPGRSISVPNDFMSSRTLYIDDKFVDNFNNWKADFMNRYGDDLHIKLGQYGRWEIDKDAGTPDKWTSHVDAGTKSMEKWIASGGSLDEYKLRHMIRKEIKSVLQEGAVKNAAMELLPKWNAKTGRNDDIDDVLDNDKFWNFVEKNWNAKDEPGKDGEIEEETLDQAMAANMTSDTAQAQHQTDLDGRLDHVEQYLLNKYPMDDELVNLFINKLHMGNVNVQTNMQTMETPSDDDIMNANDSEIEGWYLGWREEQRLYESFKKKANLLKG